MKHLLLALIIISYALVVQASQQIHTNCSDHTFAYNRMDISETDESVQFFLSGSTVFNITLDWENASNTTSFEIDKSQCFFSKDKLLIQCSASEIIVVKGQVDFGEDSVNEKKYKLNYLNIELRFVESASPFVKDGFELTSQFKVEGENEFQENRVLFYGERDSGCIGL